MSGPRVGSGFGGSGAHSNEDVEPLNTTGMSGAQGEYQEEDWRMVPARQAAGVQPTLMQQAEQFADEMVLSEIEKRTLFGRPITRKMSLAMVGGCIVAGIVLIVIIVKAISGGDDTQTETISAKEGKLRYQLFSNSLMPLVGSSVVTQGTADEMALHWLSYEDPLAINPRQGIDKVVQRFVLANIYFATKGDDWVNSCSFLSEKDECDWNEGDGVMGALCNSDGFVDRLTLSNHKLDGTIPRDLGLLTHLTHVDLSGNKLHGELPSTLGFLGMLSHLDVSMNVLSGTPPTNVKKWSSLEILRLGK
jgi:hypothetical protein